MASLAQLAKLRASKKLEEKNSSTSQDTNSNKSVNLLSRLREKQQNKENKNEDVSSKKSLLSERLASIKKIREEKEKAQHKELKNVSLSSNNYTTNNIEGNIPNVSNDPSSELSTSGGNVEISPSASNSKVKLSLKLAALRKNFDIKASYDELNEKEKNAKKVAKVGTYAYFQQKVNNANFVWDIINSSKELAFDDNSNNKLGKVKYSVNNSIFTKNTLKRKRFDSETLYSSYYPNKRKVPQKFISAENDAKKNFAELSPDEIVLEAQAKAFEDITKKVNTLKMAEKKKEEIIETRKINEPTDPYHPIDIEAYIRETGVRYVNILVVGEKGSGKSTLLGRLIEEFELLTLDQIRKIKWDAEKYHKEKEYLAWLVDKSKGERTKSSSLFPHTIKIIQDNTTYNITDLPGSSEYVSKARTWIFNSNIVLLCINCSTNSFEVGFSLDGQTRNYILLCKALGIKKLIMVMNMMETVGWDVTRYESIKKEIIVFLNDINFDIDNVSWVPISSRNGEGVAHVKFPKNQRWYKGPKLFQQITDYSNNFYGNINKTPFIFQILKRMKHPSDKKAILVSGKVASGTIQPGETMTIYPSAQSALVDRISPLSLNEVSNIPLPIAIENDSVTLKLLNSNIKKINLGDIATSVTLNIQSSLSFKVKITTTFLLEPLHIDDFMTVFWGFSKLGVTIKKIKIVKSDDTSSLELDSYTTATLDLDLAENNPPIPSLATVPPSILDNMIFRRSGKFVGAGKLLY